MCTWPLTIWVFVGGSSRKLLLICAIILEEVVFNAGQFFNYNVIPVQINNVTMGVVIERPYEAPPLHFLLFRVLQLLVCS